MLQFYHDYSCMMFLGFLYYSNLTLDNENDSSDEHKYQNPIDDVITFLARVT